MYLVEQLNELANYYSKILRKVNSNYNLTYEQGKLLLAIPFDGISMSELSILLGIDNSTMTRNSSKLMIKKLIKINSSKIDKRKKNIILTQKGNQIVNKIDNEVNKFFINLNLNNKNKRKIISTIEQLNWAISNNEH